MCKQKFVLSNNTFPIDIPFPMKKYFLTQSEIFAEKATTFTQRRKAAKVAQRKAKKELCAFFASLRLCLRF